MNPSRAVLLAASLAVLGVPLHTHAQTASPPVATLDPATREIWRSAWVWEARGRGDLARAALEKLLRTRPRDVELMLEIALIELRANRVEAAQSMRARIAAIDPQHPALGELDTAIRVLGRERIRLASVRRLQELSRHDEALAELDALFPDGPPRHTLGLDYWRIVADSADGWNRARQGFEGLVAAHPTDPRYELALAEHLSRRASTRREALQRLLALGAREDLRHEQLVAAWRRALDRASAGEVTSAMLQQYAALVPDDAEAQSWARAGRLPRRAAPPPPGLARVDDARAQAIRRAEGLTASARARLQRGERSLALRDYEAALALRPDDPWLRYELAREYAGLGASGEGEALMREALARQPTSADARFALALFLENTDREREALAVLAPVAAASRSEGMRALEARARVRVARDDAALQVAGGRREQAARTLAAAEPYAADAAGIESLARGWVALGDTARARVLVERALASRPDDRALQLARLRILDAAGDEPAYVEALQALRERDGWDAGIAAELGSRERRLELERIVALRRAGEVTAALVRADTALAQDPEPPLRRALLRERARTLVELGHDEAAVAAYAALLEFDPDDAGLRLDLADALRAVGREQDARDALAAARETAPADDIDLQLSVARRLRAFGELDAAATLLARLRELASSDPGVFEESGWLARARGDDAAARTFFARAQTLAPDKTALADAIATIDARRQGWISAGIDVESKPGDPGISDVLTTRVPVEWRWPQGYAGHWFGQVDHVELDVGRLPADYDAAALYGTVQAQGPDALDAFTDGFTPRARGTAIGIGYENARLRVDIGTTPIGFDEQDVVGGLRLFAQTGVIDWSFDLARRPVTSSLVAYAGARDPASERVWGGVRRNAASLRGAYYGARHSLSLTVDGARFEGRNVPDNDYHGLRAAYDWRLFDNGADRVFIGITATYWDYQRNQRFYTYGHGGYYSPQSYLNLGLPLQWQGLRGRWSYELYAAVAHSDSDEDSAPFFPGDPALQAQAVESPLPAGFDAPVYGGGGGSGSGYSLRAALEYRLAPRWALGARAARDRSDYYEPDFYTLYLRRVFDDAGGVLRTPPRPPRRYADY
jgi:tetratricopeptide (TPR) repeat protein